MYIVRSHTATSNNAGARSLLNKGLSELMGTVHIQTPLTGSNIDLSKVGIHDVGELTLSSAAPEWLYKAARKEVQRRALAGDYEPTFGDIDEYPNIVIDVLTKPTTKEII